MDRPFVIGDRVVIYDNREIVESGRIVAYGKYDNTFNIDNLDPKEKPPLIYKNVPESMLGHYDIARAVHGNINAKIAHTKRMRLLANMNQQNKARAAKAAPKRPPPPPSRGTPAYAEAAALAAVRALGEPPPPPPENSPARPKTPPRVPPKPLSHETQRYTVKHHGGKSRRVRRRRNRSSRRYAD